MPSARQALRIWKVSALVNGEVFQAIGCKPGLFSGQLCKASNLNYWDLSVGI